MKIRKIKLAGKRPSKDELDALCREIVFLRDKATCQVCGRQSPWKLDWMHFITRSNKAVRWDLDGSCVGCSKCHTMGKQSAHHDPLWFADWVKNRLGEKKYYELRLRATGKCGDLNSVKLYLLDAKKKLAI